MRRRISPTRVVLVGLLFLLPAPALAVQEWYDFYLQARDRDIPAQRWETCEENLREALRLRPRPGVNVQTYGLQFLDYLPHHHLGLCLLRQEKYAEALGRLHRCREGGAVSRSETRGDFARLRAEAQNAEAARADPPASGPRWRACARTPRTSPASGRGTRPWRCWCRPRSSPGASTPTPWRPSPGSRSGCRRPSGPSARPAPGPSGSSSGWATATVSWRKATPPRRSWPTTRCWTSTRATPGPSRVGGRPRSASGPRAAGPSSRRLSDEAVSSSTPGGTKRPWSRSPRPRPASPEAGELLTRTRQFIEGERRQRDLRDRSRASPPRARR